MKTTSCNFAPLGNAVKDSEAVSMVHTVTRGKSDLR